MRELVLRRDLVRQAIERLLSRKTHPAFAGYLAIKHEAARRGRTTKLKPNFVDFFDRFLRIPGGPPRKPYYRPFWHQSSAGHKAWYQANVAGSFAPNSARRIEPLVDVVSVDERAGDFSLRTDHAKRALNSLAYGRPLPAQTLAAFLYRDYSFGSAENGVETTLLERLRTDLGYTDVVGDAEFNTLFVVEDDKAFDTPFVPNEV